MKLSRPAMPYRNKIKTVALWSLNGFSPMDETVTALLSLFAADLRTVCTTARCIVAGVYRELVLSDMADFFMRWARNESHLNCVPKYQSILVEIFPFILESDSTISPMGTA